jgi:creatinine amidohydrolase
MKKHTILAEELSWTEFRERMKQDDCVVIPAGMLEEHGPHNPLGCDTFIAEYCAGKIGELADAVVAPAFPYGYGANVKNYPGSISVDPQLLRKIWLSIASCYARHGARRFLFVNGHGGNNDVLRMVGGDLFKQFGALSTSTQWWELVPQLQPEWSCDDHGGYYETSCMMAVREDLVDMSRAMPPVQNVALSPNITYYHGWGYRGTPMFITMDVYKLNKVGNVGVPPEGANRELGQKILGTYIDWNAALLREMRAVALGEKGE